MATTREKGFTLIEVMVSLAVVIIGLLGIMGLQTTTMRANRLSRGLERAKVYAGQVMEDLRGKPGDSIATAGTYPDVVTPDGVTYTRSYTKTGVTGSTGLSLITVTATFTDDSDGSQHSASLQMVRTAGEIL